MNQTRIGSLIEAAVNILIGFAINFTANLIILPLFGFDVTISDNFKIGLLFTIVSVARQYVVRRWFNARLRAASEGLARKVGGS